MATELLDIKVLVCRLHPKSLFWGFVWRNEVLTEQHLTGASLVLGVCILGPLPVHKSLKKKNEIKCVVLTSLINIQRIIRAIELILVIIYTALWSIFKRSLTGLNTEFSFFSTSCHTKVKEPSLSYYLPIAGRRIVGFIPFPRVLVLCEMQTASSRIWTLVVELISFDDNHYTMTISSYPTPTYEQDMTQSQF